jgi:hypothetical protein
VSIKRPFQKPEYEPSIADRATVQNLAAMGATHKVIAKCIGTRGISEPTLRKHFRRELDVSATEVNAMAMASIVKGLRAGEAWATCFYLKCRAGWRETQAHAFVDKDGKDRGLMLSDIDAIVHDEDDDAS